MSTFTQHTKIRLLPDHVANQIAAGEVVQRPASVLKELLENALDAGSTHVKIIVEDGGKTLIQVVDNGCGMHEIDARMSFERHATSKIIDAQDLLNITTYGFRGEALSSIAAVSEVVMKSRTSNKELGTHILVEESQVQSQEAVTMPVGTQIAVHSLFRKLPGRRNFLKSNAIEMKHIIDEFQRIALARPDVAFSFYQGKKILYQLSKTKLGLRIVHLFGKNHQKELIPCEESTDALHLKGYIGAPHEAKRTRSGQFFFVNGRYVKSPFLHHAVKQAFDQLLPQDTFPFYVLYITLPPNQLDINVHPTKTEVKFIQERFLYALVLASLRKALATHHCMHTIDFEHAETQVLFTATPTTSAKSIPPASLPKASTATGDNLWTKVLATAPSSKLFSQPAKPEKPNTLQFPLITQPTKLQLHHKYILAQVKSGLLVIDQHAAYERILYERYMHSLQDKQFSTQKLLFPYTIELQPADLALVQACQQDLQTLGFRFDYTSKTSLSITGQPSNFQFRKLATSHLFVDLLEQYKENEQMQSRSQHENWARALAKRTNSLGKFSSTDEEMTSIVNQLFTCKNPNYTPEGKKTWHIVTIEKLHTLLEASPSSTGSKILR